MAKKITPISAGDLLNCIESGKTLKSIADDCGVSVGTVYRWTRIYSISAVGAGRPRTASFVNGGYQPNPRGKRIPVPKKAGLVALIDKGLSRRELAAHYKVGATCIEKWLKQHKLKTFGTPGKGKRIVASTALHQMLAAGRTLADIAEHLGCTRKTLRRHMQEAGIVRVERAVTQPIAKPVMRSAPSAMAFQFANPFGL